VPYAQTAGQWELTVVAKLRSGPDERLDGQAIRRQGSRKEVAVFQVLAVLMDAIHMAVCMGVIASPPALACPLMPVTLHHGLDAVAPLAAGGLLEDAPAFPPLQTPAGGVAAIGGGTRPGY
jgi:hypothetical protein